MNPWFDSIPGPRLSQFVEDRGESLKARHRTDDVYFALWLQALDRAVRRRIMVSYDDLEDWDYWSAYDAGLSPRDAAVQMLDDNGYGDAYAEPLR